MRELFSDVPWFPWASPNVLDHLPAEESVHSPNIKTQFFIFLAFLPEFKKKTKTNEHALPFCYGNCSKKCSEPCGFILLFWMSRPVVDNWPIS
jgi:hypothetical protein